MLKEAFRNNEANSRSYETRVFVVFRRGLCVWRVGGDPVGGTPWLWAGAFDVCLH